MLLLSVPIKFMVCKLLLKSYIVHRFNKVNNTKKCSFVLCITFKIHVFQLTWMMGQHARI